MIRKQHGVGSRSRKMYYYNMDKSIEGSLKLTSYSFQTIGSAGVINDITVCAIFIIELLRMVLYYIVRLRARDSFRNMI